MKSILQTMFSKLTLLFSSTSRSNVKNILNNSSELFEKSGKNDFLVGYLSTLMYSFFGFIQKKCDALFGLTKFSLNNRFKVNALGVLTLVLFFGFNEVEGQTTIYSTDFGTTAVTSSSTFVAGWTSANYQTGGAAPANMSIATTSVSSGYSSPITASGGANLADGSAGTIATGTATATLAGQVNTVGYTGISVAFGYRASSTSYTGTVTLDWSSDGTNWNSITLPTLTRDGSWRAINGTSFLTLPAGAQGQSNLRFRFTFVRANTSGNFRIDDFTVKGTLASPTLTAQTLSSALTTTYGTASTAVSTTATGSNLTGSNNITITPQANFEVSTTSATTGFSSSAITGVANTGVTVWVRLAATAPVGTTAYNGITAATISGGGASSAVNITTASSGNSIAAKALTISGAAVTTKTFDSTTNATITGTLTGIVNGDIVILNGTGTFASSAVGTGIAVTSTSTLSGAGAGNYTLTQPTGLTGTIQAATSPTIVGGTATAAFTTTYGTASATQSFAISGSYLTNDITATAPTGFAISSDNITFGTSLTFTQSAGTASGTIYMRLLATAPAGSYNNASVVLSSTGATSVNITTPSSGNTVAAKALIVLGLNGVSKVYDRTTAATFTGTASYSGFVNGDSFAVTGTPVATFASATVGTAKTVTISGYTSSSTNYTVTAPTVTANITALPLTISSAAVTTKIYDGTTSATITGTLTGIISPDVVTLNGTGTFASSAIATGIAVTSTSTLAGADASNYSLTQPTGLTGTIISGPTTLAAGDVAIVSINSANPDTFSVVLLKDIGTGTVINFTDNGFATATTGSTTEGVLTFTAPSPLPFGTVLTWTNGMSITGTGWSSAAPTNFAFNGAGDQLYAFQGTGTSAAWGAQTGITVLFGINYGIALVTTGTTGASTTYQPSTSILPATAFLNLGSATYANGYFSNTGSASTSVSACGSAATILSNIVNAAKWLGTTGTAATFPTYSITTTCPPSVASTGSLTAFTTTYGTASAPKTVSVSGSNLTADLVATAPAGYEVSYNGTSWGSTATFTQTAGTASGTLSVRLAATATVSGAYNSNNIVLSSTGATSVTITTTASGNTVTPLGITITGVLGVSKVYDRTTAATLSGTAAYAGLVNGDSFASVSGSPVAVFSDKNVGTAKTITITGYTAPSTNYTVIQPTASADITAKDLTVSSIVANDAVYNGIYPTATTVSATLNGVVSPDNVTLSSTAAFTDGPYIGNFGVTATFSLNGTDVANYNLVQPDTSSLMANITPKALTISSPIAANKVYDGTTAAVISGTLVGVVSGDFVTLNGSYGTFASSSIGSNIAVTATWMIDGDVSNYTLVQPTVSLTANITSPGSPNITSSLTASANYGDSSTYYAITTDIAATSYSASGLPGGLSINTTTGEITGAPTTAGTFNVTLGADGIGGTGYATLVYTITPITITVTGASANNKVYDGTTSATISGTLVGVINSDDVSFNGVGTFDSAAVASNIGVTSNATLTGTQASNYILTNPTGLFASITSKALTVTAIVTDKVYDRTNAATVAIASINGVVGSDDVTATITGTFNTVIAGNNKPVTITNVTLGGTSAGNYSVSTPTGVMGNITQKPLTVTATANNKAFDGTNAATITVSATTGVITPDVVTVTGGGTFASSAIGTGISVTPSLVLGGADAANYSLTQPTGLTANITLAPTTLTAGDIAVIGYNTNGSPDNFAILVLKDLNPGTQFFVNDNEIATAGGTTFTDLAEGEASFTVKSGQTIPAGTVIVLPWGSTAVSTTTYDWSTTSGFGFGASNDEIYIYNASSITATTPTQFIYYAKLGTSTSAVPSGLTLGTTSIAPTVAASRYSTTGNIYNSCKSILLTEIGKTATSNWNTTGATALASTDWSFTVLATCPTPTITTSGTLAALTTVYGSASATTTSFTVAGSYLTNSITITAPTGFEVSTSATTGFVSSLTLTQTSGSVASTTIYVRLASTTTVTNSPYSGDIVCASTGATAVNVATASSTVTPKSVTITGLLVANKVQSIGDFTATLTGTPILNGVLSADTANVTLGGTAVANFTQDTAGTAIPVVVSGYSISGSAAANYALVQPSLTGTITLVASPVITSSLTFSSVYGTVASTYAITATSDASYPVTAYNASGLPTGLSVNSTTGEITGTPTATPGNYSVLISATNDGGTTTAILTYTITAKPLTVSGATASAKVYNGTTAATILGYSLNGVYGSDVVSAIGTGTFSDKNVGTAKAVTATMTLTGADAAKYTLTQPTGLTADITPLALTLSAVSAQNKVYDGTNAATITATLVGVVSGDSVTFNGTGTFASTAIGQGIAVTSTSTISGIDAGNYTFVQPTGLTANITDPVIYLNTFTGASACPTNGNVPTMASNSTGTAVTRSTITCNATANVFNSTTISTTSSLSPTSYIEFSVSAATGYKLNLTSMSFFRQASNSAPNQLEVRYSTNGFSTYNTWGAAPNSPTSGSAVTWDFANFSTAMSGTVTFRIYPYGTQRADNTGAASTTGTFRIDDVTVYGTVSLVTPPSSSVLSGSATVCSGSSTNLNVAITDGTSPYAVVYNDGTSNVTVNNYISGTNIPVSPSATTTYTLVSVTDANNLTSLNASGSAFVTVNGFYPFYTDADGDGYGTGTSVSLCAVNATTPPTGYSVNNIDCNDAVYSSTNSCSSVVNLKLNIQGYYDASVHSMRPVLANQGVGSSATDVDTITVELHDATTANLVTSTTAMLQTDGTAVATFVPAISGSFYLVVKHRNALETWSSSTQNVGPTPVSYDFTTAADKAYGSNMIELESGVYGFYSGDINQDGFIEFLDYPQLFNDSDNLLEGYQTTDLNGDGFVEFLDYPILFNNSDNLIETLHP